ncbi:lipocalin family protein [Ulvibacter antarcticus]|uniref:Lipocalin-like protein n=1 Tax=Ulvibacter antarcticus TaxID=442714 RepID=A0A3L9YUD4_9FLAO|nr:lipocalin family protein [Ulvibacter antarcticus]RMA64266.1 lipocalin-like protein [Ulvibacter antarcticus]
MKKIILLSVLVATFMSCGVPKTVQDSKKVMKGYWQLDNISYSESGTFDVTIFNDTSKECFEGSTWRFIPNNNSGLYTINNGACPTGDRNFIFTIQEIDQASGLYDFLLKPTDAKHRSDDNKGIRLRLAQLNESAMRWEQTVNVDGSPFKISMNFSKIQE